MPLFMDRHNSLNATAKSLAEAHQLDIDIQEKYSCKALTYWFDEGKQIAFCLIEAPDKKAVEEMHRNSHGLVPHQIIEVQSNLVEYFLGRISDPESLKTPKQFINETAFRSIMYINCNCFLNDTRSADRQHFGTNEILNKIIRPVVKEFDGTEVKINDKGFMVSFTSVMKSIKCALKIQSSIKEFNETAKGTEIKVSIGLSTGYPVTDQDNLFGETILLAKRLCILAETGMITFSSAYKNELEEDSHSKSSITRIVSRAEEKFLNNLIDVTEEIWNDAEANLDNFSKKLGLSKAQLYRKTISLTGTSPNNFLRNYKLNKALKLIEEKNFNISEIAFESGFSSPSYFSKCFQKKFGMLPSDFANTIA
jgi:AraC-like DNA-binding protein